MAVHPSDPVGLKYKDMLGGVKVSKMIIDIQWAFISIAISSFVHFLLRIVFGRDLGASGLGLYTLVFTFYLFGTQFANFGIGSALTKYIAEFRDDFKKVEEYASSGMAGSLAFGTAIAVCLYAFSDAIAVFVFHSQGLGGLLRALSFCFPFIALQKSVLGILNGQRRMKQYAFINIAQNTLIMLFSVGLVVFLKQGIDGAVYGLAIPTILTGLMSLFYIKGLFKVQSHLVDDILKEISSFGFYVTMANSVSLINGQASVMLIGYFLNDTEIGYFAVASLLVQGISLIPTAIQTVTGPRISHLHGMRDYGGIRRLIKDIFIKTLILTLILSGVLVVLGDYLIRAVFSPEFSPAYVPTVIMVLGYIVYSPFVAVGSALTNIGKVNIIFKIDGLCMIVSILLSIILIPLMGITGTALATSLSLVFMATLNLYVLRSVLKDDKA